MTPLIAVAHGSRDPRSAQTMAEVAAGIRQARPGLDVRLAFLDLTAPSVPEVIDTVATQGYRRAIVVPLLLGSAFHARVDLPELLAQARRRHPRLELKQAEVLGPDPLLIRVLQMRLCDHGIALGDPDIGVAVAAVGSSDPAANSRTSTVAHALAERTGWRTEACFVTASPGVEQAAAQLRMRGARRVVVAPWFLAPGLLTDRIDTSRCPSAPVLGAHPLLAEVVLHRYDTADCDQPIPTAGKPRATAVTVGRSDPAPRITDVYARGQRPPKTVRPTRFRSAARTRSLGHRL